MPSTVRRLPSSDSLSIRAIVLAASIVLSLLAAGNVCAQLKPLPSAMRPATELADPSVTRPMTFGASRLHAPPLSGVPVGASARPAAFAGPVPLPPVEAIEGREVVGAAGADAYDSALSGSTFSGNYDENYAGAPGVPYGAYDPSGALGEPWVVQFFPNGLIYRSYLAGVKESRFGVQIFHEKDDGWLWDIALGGRVGLVRYGTTNSERPEGFQIDMEGAAFPRLDPESQMDLNVADFRFGIPFTYGVGPWQVKLAYYHISSHLGDEYVLRNGLTTRFNYARDALVLGGSYFVTPSVRLYAEADWAFYQDVARPWAFQFGAEYSPPGATGPHGTPFVAIAGHLRQEIDYSGHVAVQAGWQWRSPVGHLMRLGAHYLNGLNPQFALYNDFEEQAGFGLWYDY